MYIQWFVIWISLYISETLFKTWGLWKKNHPIDNWLLNGWCLNMCQCFNVDFPPTNVLNVEVWWGLPVLTWWEWAPSRRCHKDPLTASAAQAAQRRLSSHCQSLHSPNSPDLRGKTQNIFIHLLRGLIPLQVLQDFPHQVAHPRLHEKNQTMYFIFAFLKTHTLLKIITLHIFWSKDFSGKFGSSQMRQMFNIL